jgi:hypothetical protein
MKDGRGAFLAVRSREGVVFITVYKTRASWGWKLSCSTSVRGTTRNEDETNRAARKVLLVIPPGRAGKSTVVESSNLESTFGIGFFFLLPGAVRLGIGSA